MIKNEKYVNTLKAIINCVSYGDYCAAKELSTLELRRMKDKEKQTKKQIKKIKDIRKIRKNKNIPLNNWSNSDLIELIENYSKFILKKVEESKDLMQLQEDTISIQEFLNKL